MLKNILINFQNRIEIMTLKSYKKALAFSAMFKVGTIFTMLVIMPMGLIDFKNEPYKTKISLDKTNPMALTLNKEISIATGVSNLDTSKVAKSTGQLASSKYGKPIERHGSYFQDIYKAAGSKYNVPWQLLQAVHYVETGCSDSGIKSSYAGAQGPMQFMPGTWRAYGDDGNGDGLVEIYNVNDAIYGAAHLLARGGADAGNIDAALFNYNHSQSYVNKVKDVMYSIQ